MTPLALLLAGGLAAGPAPDAKRLIIHADDLGFSHSVNAASIEALERRAIDSASLMVPCPWFPEIAAYARAHPEADLGLHLTLTSERTAYRWGPVASRHLVPSLLDENGYFRQDWPQPNVVRPEEALVEIRAQIQKAAAMGVRPTHLDSHQLRQYDNGRALFDVLLAAGREAHVPVLVARSWFAERPYLEASLGPDDVVIDRVVTISPDVPAERWATFYEQALTTLQPGVTELVIHLGFDDVEMRALTSDRATWGAAWRQRDLDVVTSPRFQELLRTQNIERITWRELRGH